MNLRPYVDIAKLVWPLALGMLNNAVLQFVDGVFLARESIESLEASLPASSPSQSRAHLRTRKALRSREQARGRPSRRTP